MKRVAVRNIRLCTKDCLCLYVCPTGASDTENSIIDVNKCIGCESCFKACPSGAISMVNVEYPKQQKKANVVVNALNEMALNKSKGEYLAREIAKATDKKTLATLMLAISKSERLIAEDIEREAGFMLPQSDNAHKMLEGFLKDETLENLPKDTIKELLHLIPNNERKGEETIMAKWKCKVCGYIHEGDVPPSVCPICKQPSSQFELVEEVKKNPYAGTKTEKNLWEAFAGESQARNKYTYFASVAKKAGYETYWFSNQGYVSDADTPITLVAKTADHAQWLCEDKALNGKPQYDGDLLNYLKKVDKNFDSI